MFFWWRISENLEEGIFFVVHCLISEHKNYPSTLSLPVVIIIGKSQGNNLIY